jgi:hypothetical protein
MWNEEGPMTSTERPHVLGSIARAACLPFLALATVGFGASVAIHAAAWLGVPVPDRAMVLHFGIFVVWIPAVLAQYPLVRHQDRKDVWRALLRGAPRSANTAVKVLFAYAVVNFGIGLLSTAPKGPANGQASLRLFSGHWMLFYGAAMAILYSARHALDAVPRCPSGHSGPVTARFCPTCGAPLSQPLAPAASRARARAGPNPAGPNPE